MGNALFYHLTRSAPESLLRPLIGKSLQAGWRVELRGRDRSRLEHLDLALWQDDGFLPHGLAGGPHDARQPVLLRLDRQDSPGNQARCLIALDGAEVAADEIAALDRCCIVFDGNNDTALERARDQWRALTGAGAVAEYWSEADGKWQKKAQSG